MEVDLLGLDLAVLHVHLRAARRASGPAGRAEAFRSGAPQSRPRQVLSLLPRLPRSPRWLAPSWTSNWTKRAREPRRIGLGAHLVAAEHDRDGLADTHDVAVPVGHVLVGHARSHIEHDDGAVALDVVAWVADAQRSGSRLDKSEASVSGVAASGRTGTLLAPRGSQGASQLQSVARPAYTHDYSSNKRQCGASGAGCGAAPSRRPPNFSWPAVSHTLKTSGPRLVWNSSGCTSTPTVAMYFFSNSPCRSGPHAQSATTPGVQHARRRRRQHAYRLQSNQNPLWAGVARQEHRPTGWQGRGRVG